MKLDAGAQMKLPVMVAAVGFPSRRESGLNGAIRVDAGEAIEDETAGEAVGLLPRIACGFNAQRTAVVRTGARRDRQHAENEGETNCRAPKHGRPHIGWKRVAPRREGYAYREWTRARLPRRRSRAECSWELLRVRAVRRREGYRTQPRQNQRR